MVRIYNVNMQGFKLRISLGKYWKGDINRGKLGIKRRITVKYC
jgi:hypothetical protein